jgi:hypothetical protein
VEPVAGLTAAGGNSEVNMESIPLSKAKELAPDREVTVGDILYFDKGLLGMSAFVCGVGDTEASAEKDCWESAEKLGIQPSLNCVAYRVVRD